jgi:hypothetical protein
VWRCEEIAIIVADVERVFAQRIVSSDLSRACMDVCVFAFPLSLVAPCDVAVLLYWRSLIRVFSLKHSLAIEHVLVEVAKWSGVP